MTAATPAQADRRRRMVERDIAGRGIKDPRVLEAMRVVPREMFVPEDLRGDVYKDRPLPIADRQTISQPYMVAAMAEAARLTPTSKVLEVGAGSGYGAAVLGRIAARVWSIERHKSLARGAAEALASLGYENVHILHGDGRLGLAEQAPFDAIVVTASAERVPRALLDQLGDDGCLIIPVGPSDQRQHLLRITRRGEGFAKQDLGAVRFVPLIGGTVTGSDQSILNG